jgi:hypothetical protein
MSSTKIINVLKDDNFDEILDIVKKTDASELIFILPKKTKAFKSEVEFASLQKEIVNQGKTAAFLSSNEILNNLAKKYNFEILSPKPESKNKTKIKSISYKSDPQLVTSNTSGTTLKSYNDVNDDDTEDDLKENSYNNNDLDEQNEYDVSSDDKEDEFENNSEEDENQNDDYDDENYLDQELENENLIEEDDPPYGTEIDDSGDPVYDEEEEEDFKYYNTSNKADDFKIITVSTREKDMKDVIGINPNVNTNKHIKIKEKIKRPVKLEVYNQNTPKDIQNMLDKNLSDNIWTDIFKPHVSNNKKNKSDLNFNSKNSSTGKFIFFITGCFLILGFVVYFTLGSANIELKPYSEDLDLSIKLAISPNFSSINYSFNQIPGQLFTISKSVSEEYEATSEKDSIQKARGTITIYNEYSTSPQPLIATTRFEYIKNEKESGLVFRTLKTVTVPGMKVEGNTIIPGKINVEVIADKPGQEYNISSGDFGIMAWREKGDYVRYKKIYGKSENPMRGGIVGKSKVVSEFDYNKAKETLTKKVFEDIDNALKNQSAGLELFSEIKPKIDLIESSANIDDVKDNFKMTVSGSITTMGYKKEDLINLISNYIEKTANLMVIPDKLKLSFKDVNFDIDKNIVTATIVVGGKAYAKLDLNQIVNNLEGKNDIQVKNYLGSLKEIESAKVILSPFWVKRIPKNQDKINISLIF